jgi:hypothetical protein
MSRQNQNSDDKVRPGDVTNAKFDYTTSWSTMFMWQTFNDKDTFLIYKWTNAGSQFRHITSSSQFKVDHDGSQIILTGTVALNTWYLSAITCDGTADPSSTVTLYIVELENNNNFLVDGVTGTISSNDSDLTAPITYGHRSEGTFTANWLDGDMAMASYLHNVELTKSEVLHYARNPWAVIAKYSDDARYFLEMGRGSPEPDFTGNGNSGTVTGAIISPNPPLGPRYQSRIMFPPPPEVITLDKWEPELVKPVPEPLEVVPYI